MILIGVASHDCDHNDQGGTGGRASLDLGSITLFANLSTCLVCKKCGSLHMPHIFTKVMRCIYTEIFDVFSLLDRHKLQVRTLTGRCTPKTTKKVPPIYILWKITIFQN